MEKRSGDKHYRRKQKAVALKTRSKINAKISAIQFPLHEKRGLSYYFLVRSTDGDCLFDHQKEQRPI
jgi:hypothetical protein